MAKLVLSLDGSLLNEYPLDKERISIGRRPTNDIHIDNLAMSGLHATILTIGNDSFLEDLGSTNGTYVNGKSVKKHLLQHDEVIEFGKYHLKYENEKLANKSAAENADDFEKTMIIRPSAKPVPVATAATPVSMAAKLNLQATSKPVTDTSPLKPSEPITPTPIKTSEIASDDLQVANLQVLNGSSKGRELVLNKALTTLGKPGVQVAVITKRKTGYFVTHVEGKTMPIVNSVTIGVQAYQLSDHDIIELAGVKMEFYFSS